MKSLKLEHDLAELVKQGEKTSTWRINDEKNLSVDDKVILIDKVDKSDPASWKAVGVATIDQVVQKRLGELTADDKAGHEAFVSDEEMYQTYRKYYGPSVGPDTSVKIINFTFEPYSHPETPEEPEVQIKEAKLYTDGGSRGNPGPSAIGFVLMDMNDHIVKKEGLYLGITTNNQAEYQGLKSGLEAAKEFGVRELDVYMDSLLVVNQMKGIFKVKNRDLWPIYQSAKDMLSDFSKVTFNHVPRELNKIADEMVNECLDNQ